MKKNHRNVRRSKIPRILLLWRVWDRTPIMAGIWAREQIADRMGSERVDTKPPEVV